MFRVLAHVAAGLVILTSALFGQLRSFDYSNMTAEEIEQLTVDRHAFYKAKSEAKDGAIKRELLNAATKVDGNQHDYDVRYYGIDLSLNFSGGTISGHVDYGIKSVVSNLGSVDLNLHGQLTVDAVTVDGATAAFSHLSDILTITTPTSYSSGQEFEMTVSYHGTPYFAFQQGMGFGWDTGYEMCWTNCEPYASRHWWPCKDYPLDKPDSIDIHLEYPSTYTCVSNGAIISDVSIGGGRNRIHYKHMYPIATYLVAITCANFDEDVRTWNYDSYSMPVYSYALPNSPESLNAYITHMRDVLTRLSDKWGTYPYATEKAGNANYGWGGAMEHQTCSFYSPWFYTDWVIAHETAHQWWGDMITCRTFNHIWLNEGFASYSEPIYFESRDGQAAYFNYMQSQKRLDAGTPYVENLLTDNIFDQATVYDKASWVVHMLRGVLGDDLFFEVIANYYDSEFKYGSATTEDLAAIVSNTVGEDMSWFFNQWIYHPYQPDYEVSHICEPADGGGYDLTMFIEQTQSSDPFRMPIQTIFHTTGGNLDTTIQNETAGEVYLLWFADSVTSIELDPDEWILRRVDYVPLSFHIATRTLPDGEQDVYYDQELEVIGGVPPFNWTHLGGDLPLGLQFHGGTDGIIDGTPTWPAEYFFTLQVTDSDSPPSSETWGFSLRITEPQATRPIGDADGNGIIEVSDVVFLVNYVFVPGSPAPDPIEYGDADCNGIVEITDAVFLVSYIFVPGSPAPDCP